jgi:phage repressor protein C with HTH and peptisase S24 domain
MAKKKDPHADKKRAALRAFIERNNLTPTRWAEDAGIRESTLRNYLKGISSSLTHSTAEKLAARAGVTVDQLFAPASNARNTGRLPEHAEIHEIDSLQPEQVSFPPGLAPIAEVDVRAGMGGGGEVDAINHVTDSGYSISKDAVKVTWGVPEAYLRELGVSVAGAFMFRVQGDSMTKPDGSGIHSGDLVIADTHDRRPSPPGIFALWDGFGTIVKRLEFIMGSEPARLMIASDNPNHRTFERAMDEVNIIGRLVWYGRRL